MKRACMLHADPDGSIRKTTPKPIGHSGGRPASSALPNAGGSVAAQAWARLTHRVVPEYTGKRRAHCAQCTVHSRSEASTPL